jgi:hypothetical protein
MEVAGGVAAAARVASHVQQRVAGALADDLLAASKAVAGGDDGGDGFVWLEVQRRRGDVVLGVEHMPVHRLVLRARCRSWYSSLPPPPATVIPVSGLSPAACEAFLHFVHSGRLPDAGTSAPPKDSGSGGSGDGGGTSKLERADAQCLLSFAPALALEGLEESVAALLVAHAAAAGRGSTCAAAAGAATSPSTAANAAVARRRRAARGGGGGGRGHARQAGDRKTGSRTKERRVRGSKTNRPPSSQRSTSAVRRLCDDMYAVRPGVSGDEAATGACVVLEPTLTETGEVLEAATDDAVTERRSKKAGHCRVHRWLLTARSEYFRAALSECWQPPPPPPPPPPPLEDCMPQPTEAADGSQPAAAAAQVPVLATEPAMRVELSAAALRALVAWLYGRLDVPPDADLLPQLLGAVQYRLHERHKYWSGRTPGSTEIRLRLGRCWSPSWCDGAGTTAWGGSWRRPSR